MKRIHDGTANCRQSGGFSLKENKQNQNIPKGQERQRLKPHVPNQNSQGLILNRWLLYTFLLCEWKISKSTSHKNILFAQLAAGLYGALQAQHCSPQGALHRNPAPAFAAPSLHEANSDPATEISQSPFTAMNGQAKLQEAEGGL